MADGTSICPRCDFIIDASFLSDDAPAASAKPRPASRPPSRATGARPAPRGTGVRPASRPGPPVQSVPPTRRPQRGPPPEEESTRITSALPSESQTEPPSVPPARPARPASRPARAAGRAPSRAGSSAVKTAAARLPREKAPAPPPAPLPTYSALPRVTGSHRLVSPEEMLTDLKNFFLELGQSDKLAFVGACVTVLLSFIPWKSTATDGDILGLVSLGAFVLLAALATMASVAVRVRKVMPQLNPIIPWLVQLGTAGFAILWCLVFIKISWNGQQVPADIGNEMVPLSSPSAGVFLALLSSIVSLVGTLMGLKEKPN